MFHISERQYINSSYEAISIDLPGDLPRLALTTILHITPGTYEPSCLKFVIVI